ncbi:hypothetical protein M5E87_12960 [Flavonifractor plautii]|nr:hypothetical protein M5E87_12960 [Flavonifractor plautii]
MRIGVLGLGAMEAPERCPTPSSKARALPTGTTPPAAIVGSGPATGRSGWKRRTATWWWWSATPDRTNWPALLRRPPASTCWWAATARRRRRPSRTPTGSRSPGQRRRHVPDPHHNTLSPRGGRGGREHPAPLSDYEPDDRLNKALSAAQSAASDRMQAAVGTLSGDWSEEGSPLYVQSATVDLVAEAMLWAADADAALSPAASRFSGRMTLRRSPCGTAPRWPRGQPRRPGGAHRRRAAPVAGPQRGGLSGGAGRLHLRRRGCRRALWYGLRPLSGGF